MWRFNTIISRSANAMSAIATLVVAALWIQSYSTCYTLYRAERMGPGEISKGLLVVSCGWGHLAINRVRTDYMDAAGRIISYPFGSADPPPHTVLYSVNRQKGKPEMATDYGRRAVSWYAFSSSGTDDRWPSVKPRHDQNPFRTETLGIYHAAATLVLIPFWPIVAVLGLGPAYRLARLVRGRVRQRKGFCQTCGYDLRATSKQCPECGQLSRSGKEEVGERGS